MCGGGGGGCLKGSGGGGVLNLCSQNWCYVQKRHFFLLFFLGFPPF